jgi:hypothetical protein
VEAPRAGAAAGAVRTSRPRQAASAARPRALAPGLQRPRRILRDPHALPSTLDVDRYAQAARTGHAELAEHLRDHTESSPALTAGDVDADWARAYDSGDEAPGGDNPTPDQDVVDEIGGALGVHYDDAEELKGADKISKRDQHRWELDPASSDDYRNRVKDED